MTQLAKPPVIDTDIPTNEQFLSRTISGVPAGQALSVATVYADLPAGFIAPTWSGLAARYGNSETVLRAINPTLSAAWPGASIDIDAFRQIDTTYYWRNGFSYYTPTAEIPPPRVNFEHRYALSSAGILGMDLAPAGHGQSGQGIYAFVSTIDNSVGGLAQLRGAFHRRGLKAQDYASGWRQVGISLGLDPDAQALQSRSYGRVASQRLGNWVYFFGWTSKYEVTSYAPPDPNGYRAPDRYDTFGKLGIFKVGADGVQTVTLLDLSTAGEDPAAGNSLVPLRGLDSIDGLPSEAGGRCSFFVSDDATPFIWHTAGDISGDVTSPGSSEVWSTGFADDGGAIGTWKRDIAGVNHVTGQVGAYLQRTEMPAGQYGFGPYLVFPWTAGPYGPPEQWFFIHRGGSRFDIYRARWLRGQHRGYADVDIADDPDYHNGARRFPSRNPSGYAFEHGWYQPANMVGKIGPFNGADVHNPLTDGSSAGADQMRFPYFAVLRDQHRVGHLHLVMGDGAPVGGGL